MLLYRVRGSCADRRVPRRLDRGSSCSDDELPPDIPSRVWTAGIPSRLHVPCSGGPPRPRDWRIRDRTAILDPDRVRPLLPHPGGPPTLRTLGCSRARARWLPRRKRRTTCCTSTWCGTTRRTVPTNRWHGGGAEALGLPERVSRRRFVALLEGHVPGTDIRLGRVVDGKHQHRPGWDCDLLGAEVGIAGGTASRQQGGDAGARRVGACGAGLDGGGVPSDPGLRPRDRAASQGEGGRSRGGDLPARCEPQQRPAAPYARGDRQHDAERGGRVAERGADAAPAQPASDRGVVPERSGAAAWRDGLRAGSDPGGRAAELRACGVLAGDAGGVLDAPPRHPRLHGGQGLELQREDRAGGDAVYAEAEGRARAWRAVGDVEGPRRGTRACPGCGRGAAGPDGARLRAPAGALHGAGSGLAGGRPPGGAPCGVQRIRPAGGGSGPRARTAHACRFAGGDRAAARGRPSGRRRRRRADDAAHAQGREGGGPAHAGGQGHGTASRSRRGGRRTPRRDGADGGGRRRRCA